MHILLKKNNKIITQNVAMLENEYNNYICMILLL